MVGAKRRTTAKIIDEGEDDNEERTDVFFRYWYPQVDIDIETRSKTHEPIGVAPVTEYIGPGKTTINMKGHCYLDTAQDIKKLNENERVRLDTEEFDGHVMLEDVSIESEGVAGGVPPRDTPPQSNNRPRGPTGDRNNWRYTYNMEFTAVRGV